MSDVRLSNGSPPLERVDARPEGHTRPSVCRNLFGSPDPEEIKRASQDELRESEAANREKYNFDFVADTPLNLKSRNFEWVQVDARDVPAFYSRATRESTRVDLNGSRTDCQKTHSAAKKRPSLEDADSARQSKRVNHGEEDCSSQDRAEQTPRKSDPST